MRWKQKLVAVAVFLLSAFWVAHALTAEGAGHLLSVQFLGLCLVLFSGLFTSMAAAGARLSRPADIPPVLFEFLGFALMILCAGVPLLG